MRPFIPVSAGKGRLSCLLHGYSETRDIWAPMAADLVRNYTVVVPDLRRLDLSSKPQSGFGKKAGEARML